MQVREGVLEVAIRFVISNACFCRVADDEWDLSMPECFAANSAENASGRTNGQNRSSGAMMFCEQTCASFCWLTQSLYVPLNGDA